MELTITQMLVVLFVIVGLGVVVFYETKRDTGHPFPILQTCIVLGLALLVGRIAIDILYP